MSAPEEGKFRKAARTFETERHDLLAPVVEALRDLADQSDPTPDFAPRVTGSRRQALADSVKARLTAGIAPAVGHLLERQARFNRQVVATLLDAVRRLQMAQAGESTAALHDQIRRLEARIAALEAGRKKK